MWYEYPIPTNFEKQKESIRRLRKWIESLGSRGIVQGFAFDHYFPSPESVNVRFDCKDDENLKVVRKELDFEVKKLLPNYNLEERLWDAGRSPEEVYKAYEFGSRCAFLAWNLIESGRFPEEYFSSFFTELNGERIALLQTQLDFQRHFNHGVMNSLGILKYPNEAFIHFFNLMDSTKSKSKQDLVNWIQKVPP
jgi:hypothetical protein